MERSGIFMVVFISIVAMATAQQNSGVRATNNQYNSIPWDDLYCATYDSNPSSGLPWTAFCDPSGPPAPAFCGKCLKVTNEDGGAQVTVMIVDQCSNGGLDLDTSAFNQIDSDGNGQAQGHLIVDYEFVDC